MMNIATHIQWRKFSWKKGGKLYEFPKYLFWICILQLFAFKHKPQTFSRVCLRFITWRLPFEREVIQMRKYICQLECETQRFCCCNCHCICVAIFIILESQSEKLWDQNYKLRPQNYKLRSQNYKLRSQNYKLRSQNYKLRPQNYKLRVQNLQVWQLKLISYNFLKRCFECTVNGSLQMVV